MLRFYPALCLENMNIPNYVPLFVLKICWYDVNFYATKGKGKGKGKGKVTPLQARCGPEGG
jgi:hypothetical protein